MEPLQPATREALKKAHPGLADEDIDRFEELLSERFRLDPQRDASRIAELDYQRLDLLKAKMPHYDTVVRSQAGERRQRLKPQPEVKVEINPGE
jgi:hypothetical protein